MIRRTLIVGLLALVALALGAPALTGLYLAREFDQAIARIERPGVLKVASARFNRGWFVSKATLRISLADALCSQPCPSVQLTSRIHHGPIPFTAPVDSDIGLRPSLGVAETRVDMAGLWPRLVFDPGLPKASVVTRVGFDGRVVSRLNLAGTSLNVSRERRLAHLDMDAVSAQLTQPLGTAWAEGRVHGTLAAPAFRLVGESGGQLVWRGLALRVPGAEAPGVPAHQLTLDTLNLADGLGTAGRVSALDARWQPVAGNPPPGQDGRTRLDGSFDMRAAQLAFDNSQAGPVIIEGELAHLDWRAVRVLGDRLINLYDNNGVLDPDVRAEIYGQILPRLLADTAVMDIKRLHILTPDGDIDAHLRIAAPEQLRPVRLLADVISQLDVDMAFRVPAPMARNLATQMMLAGGRSPYDIEETDIDTALAELVADGLIEALPEDNAYRFALTVNQGRLKLNGRNQIGWQSVVDQFEAARERL